MHPPQGDRTDGYSPLAALVEILSDDVRRMSLLVVVAYVTGPLGLGVTVLTDIWAIQSEGAIMSAGIVLMSTSFFALFLVSVTLPGIHDEKR